MICWFDDVLLILIHGFVVFRVDLASPQVFPPSIHEISSILTPKSSVSAQKIQFRAFPTRTGLSGPPYRTVLSHQEQIAHRSDCTLPNTRLSARIRRFSDEDWTVRYPGPDYSLVQKLLRLISCFGHIFHIRSPILTFFSSLSCS